MCLRNSNDALYFPTEIENHLCKRQFAMSAYITIGWAANQNIMRPYLPDSERNTFKCILKTKNALNGI